MRIVINFLAGAGATVLTIALFGALGIGHFHGSYTAKPLICTEKP